MNVFARILGLPSARTAPAAAPKPAAATVAPQAPHEMREEEGRVQFRGLLWRPVVTVDDAALLVVAARAGLPHCAHCEKPLSLAAGSQERWVCPNCGEAHSGVETDFFAAESVAAARVREFLSGHPGFQPAPGLPTAHVAPA
ncbi:MAG: hypothetical protein HKL90_02890 [Elusimicrobia bacterium]|nr:hypothetical protein [Elusimicrobiota bacterium]